MEEQSYLNLNRGTLYFLQKNYIKAQEEFLKSLQKKETSLGYTLYGASLYWMGDNDGAIENYKKAIQLDPKNDIAWQLEGIAHARDGRLNQALESFMKSYSINQSRSDTIMNISSVYFSLGNITKATEYAKKAINMDSENPLYYYQLGLIKLYEENLEEAQKNFEKAAILRPDYEEAILWNGITLELLGFDKDATKNYEKAIRIKKQDYFARYKLARLYANKNILKKDLLFECFKLELSKNNHLPLQLTYSVKDKSNTRQTSQMIDDIINNSENGDEIYINVDAINKKNDFTLEKKTNIEDKRTLQKALSKRFDRNITTVSKTFVIIIDRNNPSYKENIEKIKAEIGKLSENSTRINISANVKKSSLSKNDSESTATYIPRNTGNDMGLWLIGNPWAYLLEEELNNTDLKINNLKLISALGFLLLGNTSNSKKLFNEVKEIYPDIAYLGLGVAEYLDGNKNLAKEYFNKAREFPKSKNIATTNLRYINGDK